ncbi:protein phosphatase 1 regulatory subunit 37-like [Choloepus didactylus]|uniref:protein phosphatase 1 regulatory subunit 37-like n=1 Tax=Choloepus didactylus TaxID=27675 RepID=UPI00189FE43D|nr:protein phosphatase 1 regulatory subunit 37-like [Choloepus didactylus]
MSLPPLREGRCSGSSRPRVPRRATRPTWRAAELGPVFRAACPPGALQRLRLLNLCPTGSSQSSWSHENPLGDGEAVDRSDPGPSSEQEQRARLGLEGRGPWLFPTLARERQIQGPGPPKPPRSARDPPTCPTSCAALGPARTVGTPQLGCTEPSGQAARFPASLPAPAGAPPSPSRRPATAAEGPDEWGEGPRPDCGVLRKEGLGTRIPGS